jgi:cell division topological specificity factor
MSLLSLLIAPKSSTASVAKERLQIIIAHEHNGYGEPEFLQSLHMALIDVISKYTKVGPDDITISLGRQGNLDVLDVNVVLSDE